MLRYRIAFVCVLGSLLYLAGMEPSLAHGPGFGSDDPLKLVADLQSKDAQKRQGAAVGLAMVPRQGFAFRGVEEKVIPPMIRALKDPDPCVRSYVAYALGRAGPVAKEAAPGLASLLEDRDVDVRRAGARGLLGLGPGAAKAAPALIRSLEDKDKHVRLLSAGALTACGQKEDALARLLEKAFNEADSGPDYNPFDPVDIVGEIGKPAIPALIECLRNKKPRVRLRATDGFVFLGGLGEGKRGKFPHEAVRALTSALKDEDKEVAGNAMFALSSIGPPAKGAIPAVVEKLNDPDPYVRYCAADSLRFFGRDAEGAIPALKKALKDDDERVRRAAEEGLKAITSPPLSRKPNP